MKYISLLVLLVISSISYSQRLIRTPYEIKMDSISISRLCNIIPHLKVDNMKSWSPVKRLKFTFKAKANRNVFAKIYNDIVTDKYDLDTEDYLSLGAYDLRVKYYISKKIRITGRMVITGVETTNYFYSYGLIIKI